MPGEQEQRVARRIRDVLESPATRYWVKTVLELGLLRDPVEAADDARTLASVLKEWCTGVFLASRQPLEESERTVSSIERLLMTHDHSDWLRTALQLALHRDPVDAAADAEMVEDLLSARCAAILECDVAEINRDREVPAQLHLALPARDR
jgi:hypothetical protein